MLALRPNCECCDKALLPKHAKVVTGNFGPKFRIVRAERELKKVGCVTCD